MCVSNSASSKGDSRVGARMTSGACSTMDVMACLHGRNDHEVGLDVLADKRHQSSSAVGVGFDRKNAWH